MKNADYKITNAITGNRPTIAKVLESAKPLLPFNDGKFILAD